MDPVSFMLSDQARLAIGAIAELQAFRALVQVAPKEQPEQTATKNEPVAILGEAKSPSFLDLIVAEGAP